MRVRAWALSAKMRLINEAGKLVTNGRRILAQIYGLGAVELVFAT